MRTIILLPGIGGSGETHWQSLWEGDNATMRRFRPGSWDEPDLADWMTALESEIQALETPPVLVAHSLACLLVAHWQRKSSLPVAGAFLVAVPDPSSASFPREAAGFAAAPTSALRFPSLIVASSDDPYGSLDYARGRSRQWRSGFVTIGPHGHINGQSGLGRWQQGEGLLQAFMAGLGSEPDPIRLSRPDR